MKRTLTIVILAALFVIAGAVYAQDVELGEGEAITPSYLVAGEFERAEITPAADGLYTITFSGADAVLDAILLEPEFGYEPLVSAFVYTIFGTMDDIEFTDVVVSVDDMKLTFTLTDALLVEAGSIQFSATLTDVQADGVDMAKFRLPAELESVKMFWTLDSDFVAAYRDAITAAGMRSGNGSNGF